MRDAAQKAIQLDPLPNRAESHREYASPTDQELLGDVDSGVTFCQKLLQGNHNPGSGPRAGDRCLNGNISRPYALGNC